MSAEDYFDFPTGPPPIVKAILELAKAIEHLAQTQEKPVIRVDKGAVHFGIANFEDQPDSQTAQIREIERERSGKS